MTYKKSLGSKVFDTFNYLFLIFVIIIMLYPLLNVFAVSLSNASAVTAGKVTWYPRGFNINGYKIMFANNELLIAYKNTILYAGVGTFLTLLFTSLAAYALATEDFIFKKFFMIFWTITLFFSGGLIPTYLLILKLGLRDTFWVMVLPTCISAFNIIVFRTFFKELPNDLRESAYIDGANDLLIWYKIILPLSKPLLATFALFSIVGHWNSWFPALLYLRDPNKFPLQMILRKLVVQEDVGGSLYADTQISALVKMGELNPKNVQMAAIMIAMIPILCLYPYIQRYFVKGVMIGSIKG